MSTVQVTVRNMESAMHGPEYPIWGFTQKERMRLIQWLLSPNGSFDVTSVQGVTCTFEAVEGGAFWIRPAIFKKG